MSMIDQRAVLARLVHETKTDYASLSRLLGRNAAYVQQFIKRGVPRRLDERDRRTLAQYFGIDEEELGGEPSRPVTSRGTVSVPRLDVGASAGHGAHADGEPSVGQVSFDARWLRELCRTGVSELSFIRVQGDSMAPTLADGDDILVNRGDATQLRDGVYVMRRDDGLMVKRLAVNPATRRIAVQSDNPAYASWPDCDPASLNIVGRVIWAGRRID